MSESSSKEPKDQPESNPLDLSEFQSFSFGTQWSDAGTKSKGEHRQGSGRSPGKGRRQDRRSGGGGPPKDRRPPRRSFSDRPANRDGQDRSRGPRDGGDRRFQNRNREGGRGYTHDRPYESAVFDVGFYPDDSGFTTIIKALRANHITYELFEVAKIFLEKPDRFVASVTRKAPKGEKPERVFVSIPDGMPFATEEEAIQHAVANCIDSLFDTQEVEVEAPTGNFQFVNRCGITKKLLGPPNYHRYEEFVSLHHKTQLGHMPFEKFQSSIEQVREEEAVNEWLESMKKATRYTSRPAEGEEAQTFESISDAIGFVRTTQRDKIVREVNYARVSGTVLEEHANTEAARAVKGELERQRRFPLETANAIRGRLRREKFSIYKRGAKGVTLICSTRRNFRTKGQVMAESLDRLIRFLEANQNIKLKELQPVYKEWLKTEDPESEFDDKKLIQDLHWLIADGYVSHFADDSLFAQPVMENEPKEKPAKPESDGADPSAPAEKAETETKSESPAAPETIAEEGEEKPSPQPEPSAEAAEASVEDATVEDTAVEAPSVEPKAEEPVSEPEPAGETVEASNEASAMEATEEATPEPQKEEEPVAEAVVEEVEEPVAASAENSDTETEEAKPKS